MIRPTSSQGAHAARFTPRAVACATVLALLPVGAAMAQAAPGAAGDGLKLERVVVTGTSIARTKMQQSVSVSTIGAEDLLTTGAGSAAELLRSVPGVRSESSGGEGNANITVRGVPISAGGSRYVQLQEDGLPVLLIGDVSFATADQFVRADGFVDAIDVIRGGSAGTLATNSPGGIINFQSRTGKFGGGSVGYTMGLDHRQNRLDFDFGGKLGDAKTYFQLGGFHRSGESTRNTDAQVENGGQFRASLTREFDGGYVRATFKHLDDRTPTFLPVPVQLTGSTISELPGVDPRTAFFINSNFPSDTTVGRDGNRVRSNPADGLAVQVNAIGLEAQFNLGNGIQVTNRFRKSDISGRFIGLFPAGAAPTDAANGADRYTGTASVFSAHIFNTSLDDMGNTFNDLRVQKAFDLGGSKLTAVGGLFSGTQNVGQTWYWNRYNVGLTGDGAKLYDNAGNVTTQPVGDATTTWGGCCYRSIDVRVRAQAPYAALTWEQGPLTLDASVRHDSQRANGSQVFGTATGWNEAGRSVVNYRTSATSFSVGGNYALSKDMAAFVRLSEGSSWASPDRVIWDTDVAKGAKPYPVNEVSQIEAGLKWRQCPLSSFLTLFKAKTKEDGGFEVTSRTYLKDTYDAYGLEAEASWRSGNWQLRGGATLTQAEIAATGKKPRRQADLVYQISPSYRMGAWQFGGEIQGTTKSYADNANTVVLPGFTVVNAFANVEVAQGLTVQLGVNNLFDAIGYTEAEGQGNLTNNPIYVARSINGRSLKASLRYTF